jgi:c-di-GMP-binding flagellar brake protein YcgR
MKDIKFKINGRLEVYHDTEVYRSSIQDAGEDYIVINVPIKDGMYITPEVQSKLEVLYYDDLCVYKFNSVVIKRRLENGIPQIVLANPENAKKIQRRQHVRVGVIDYLQYVKIEEGMSTAVAAQKLKSSGGSKGLLLDLSGGGFRLKVYEQLNIGDRIVSYIECEQEKVVITGKVVRIEKDDDGRANCGFSFTDMDYKSREKVVQVIFLIMRKQRRTL